MTTGQDHWNTAYEARDEDRLTWFEGEGGVSQDLIAKHWDGTGGVLIAGAGLSRLPDRLWQDGARDLTVLDISDRAVAEVVARFPEGAVAGIVADLTRWKPDRSYGLWQDRAVFHFLTAEADQAAYLAAVSAAITPGGLLLIGTFAEDGPEKCSNLPVQRYSPNALVARVQRGCGTDFDVVETLRHEHVTPMGRIQPFTFAVFRRVAPDRAS